MKDDDHSNHKTEPIAIVMPANHSENLPKHILYNPGINTDIVKDFTEKIKVKEKNELKSVNPEWTITPSTDLSKLGEYYLMLSKFRLTCKL